MASTDMQSISNNHHNVPLQATGATTATTPPAIDQEMHLSKLLTTATALTATAAALKQPYSVDVGPDHASNEGPVRRLRTVVDSGLTETIPGHPYILTVYDLVRNAVEAWTDKECLGSRRVIRQHQEKKNITKLVNGVEQQIPKTWTYSELSPYEYRSYTDLGKETNAIGSGLRKLGLEPGDNVELYAETSYLPLLISNIVPNGNSLLKVVHPSPFLSSLHTQHSV
jgi:hypothetical protein